jgi:hypothetical protein
MARQKQPHLGKEENINQPNSLVKIGRLSVPPILPNICQGSTQVEPLMEFLIKGRLLALLVNRSQI